MNIRPEDYHPQGSSSTTRNNRPTYQRQISDNGDLMVRMESNRSLYHNDDEQQQLLLEDDDILADLKSLTVQPNKGGGGGATTSSNTTTTTTTTTIETSLEDDNNFLKKILGDVHDDDDLFDDNNKTDLPLPSQRAQPRVSIDDDDLIGNKSMVMPTPVVVAPSIDNGFQTPVSTNSNKKRRKYSNNPYYDLEPPTTPEINIEQKMMSLDMRYRILSNIDILSAPSCLTTMGMESSSPNVTPSELQSRSLPSPRKRMVTRKPNFNIALHKMMSTRNPSLLKLRKEEEREYNNQ